ncbi:MULTISPECIES: PEP-CTERM/exosortase system-associated acyltransferase [unclassified Agarivorans]|uniref:PEP-CTERM/exosortase system-associated acyltransferase n=1 Tax=unclassified Agarivorans TaxID=2636026 RepID=UPI0026E237ED|nr:MULTISPECIES: PEP-CTERM/exosortase system-associated acyltransferase [unclassified Agarivorans]MDO6684790.1 PEP-CTERM/exosortase system-associated acyltransferase [Agarivorans sp. 3_MG-2023]MDO6715049.1 PEP-CTERM/exosortase system-associated acyltransferase [Agarivorans sp. 2_MG-2023]
MKNKILPTSIKGKVVGLPTSKTTQHAAQKKAAEIAKHYETYFQPLVALSDEDVGSVYRLRHDVYCEELGFEPVNPEQVERDEFDDYSDYCLVRHLSSGIYASTVRVVSPTGDQLLPLEKYCEGAITDDDLHPQNFAREDVCEISRLALRATFRRRKTDKFVDSATGGINVAELYEEELRCFPFITASMYLAATVLVERHNIKHAYVMMEPRLARSTALLGIKFQQIGPVVEYHGQRAPYYITAEKIRSDLPITLKPLMDMIEREVNLSLSMSSVVGAQESILYRGNS